MAKTYKEYKNRKEWLLARENTIGASEVASILGLSEKTAIALWEEKTKRNVAADLSNNDRVNYGLLAEEHLRALFALQNKEKYAVEYYPYRVYAHDKYSFLTATLDGELIRFADNTRGVWECKTAWICSKRDLSKWTDGAIPQKYYAQVCEQLAITNYEFAIVTAQLIYLNGSSEIKHYQIERVDIEDDIKYVEKQAADFYERYILTDKKPPLTLPL